MLLISDGYEGDVYVGQSIEVVLPSGDTHRSTIQSIAWGSGFRAQTPPLTLVTDPMDELPAPGAAVRSVES